MRSNGYNARHTRNVLVGEPCANVDFKYGPYPSVQEAFDELEDLEVLAVGLTVGIETENGIEEYWFKKSCASVNDLIKKSNSQDFKLKTINGNSLLGEGNLLIDGANFEFSAADFGEEGIFEIKSEKNLEKNIFNFKNTIINTSEYWAEKITKNGLLKKISLNCVEEQKVTIYLISGEINNSTYTISNANQIFSGYLKEGNNDIEFLNKKYSVTDKDLIAVMWSRTFSFANFGNNIAYQFKGNNPSVGSNSYSETGIVLNFETEICTVYKSPEDVKYSMSEGIKKLVEKVDSALYIGGQKIIRTYTFDNIDKNLSTFSNTSNLHNRKYYEKISYNGVIDNIEIKCSGKDVVYIYIANFDNDNNIYNEKEVASFEVKEGINKLDLSADNIIVNDTNCISVYFSSSDFYFIAGPNTERGFEKINNGGTYKSGVLLAYILKISEYKTEKGETTAEYIKKIEEGVKDIHYKNNVSYIPAFIDNFSDESSIENWRLLGDSPFAFESGKLSCKKYGNLTNNKIRLVKPYMCDKRIARFYIDTIGDDSIVYFIFDRENGNSGEGESAYILDCRNKKLKMLKKNDNWLGVSLSDVCAETDINFAITNNSKYIVELSKNDYTFTFSFLKVNTSEKCSISVSGWDAGRQQYWYSISQESGTFVSINRFEILLPKNPELCLVGDSITEGVGMYQNKPDQNNLDNRWSELVRNEVGNSIISAVGGDDITTVLKKFESEFNIIKPKNILLHIGTNGGNTVDRLKQFIDNCINIGANPIIACVNCNSMGNYIEINNDILNLYKSPSYGKKFRIVRFDIATAVDNQPFVTEEFPSVKENNDTRYDKNMFVDHCHPNYFGCLSMYKRVKIDLPELFERY